MSTDMLSAGPPAFYTVREAARILRVDPATLYRAIRDDAFPALRVRTRYVVPAAALHQLVNQAASPAAASMSPGLPPSGAWPVTSLG
jgi:excisionase family DNA binding protein